MGVLQAALIGGDTWLWFERAYEVSPPTVVHKHQHLYADTLSAHLQRLLQNYA